MDERNVDKDMLLQKAYELGYQYEGDYGACPQCTLLAIMDAVGQRNSNIFKAAFGFAGGVGNLSKMCGAFAGGVMAISLDRGRELENLQTQTEEENRACMLMVKELHDRFIEEYGSIECADIHQRLFGRTFDQWDEEDFEEFLALGGHDDKCTSVVGNAAAWTTEILLTDDS